MVLVFYYPGQEFVPKGEQPDRLPEGALDG